MSINDFRLYGSNKKAQGRLDLGASEPSEEVVSEEIPGSAAGGTPLPVPTPSSTKAEIKEYLTYEHGVDPDDLNLTKAELLELVDDLNK